MGKGSLASIKFIGLSLFIYSSSLNLTLPKRSFSQSSAFRREMGKDIDQALKIQIALGVQAMLILRDFLEA
jgi:hypothetical protein